jgi:hypothetical protein
MMESRIGIVSQKGKESDKDKFAKIYYFSQRNKTRNYFSQNYRNIMGKKKKKKFKEQSNNL